MKKILLLLLVGFLFASCERVYIPNSFKSSSDDIKGGYHYTYHRLSSCYVLIKLAEDDTRMITIEEAEEGGWEKCPACFFKRNKQENKE